MNENRLPERMNERANKRTNERRIKTKVKHTNRTTMNSTAREQMSRKIDKPGHVVGAGQEEGFHSSAGFFFFVEIGSGRERKKKVVDGAAFCMARAKEIGGRAAVGEDGGT